MTWTSSVSRQWNATNRYSYRFGDETIATLGAQWAGSRHVAVTLLGKLFNKQRSLFHDTAVPSTGAAFAYLNPGMRFRIGDGSVYAVYQAPVYRRVNETQLAPRRGLLIGMSVDF